MHEGLYEKGTNIYIWGPITRPPNLAQEPSWPVYGRCWGPTIERSTLGALDEDQGERGSEAQAQQAQAQPMISSSTMP